MSKQATARRHTRQAALSRPASFVVVALVFVSLFAAAAAPAPLLVVYQAEWGFAPWLLTFAFAIYAIALLIALLVAGALSDHIGRKPVIIGAVVIQIIAMTLLLVASNIGVVVAARIVQGIATGVATGALSAALTDLAPSHSKKLGGMVASLAPVGGLALGALVTGALISTTHHADTVVFATLGVLYVVSLVLLPLTHESVSRRPGALRSLIPHAAVPPAARREFAAGVPGLIALWALAGFYLALSPAVLRDVFHTENGLIDGTVIAIAFGMGALTITLLRRLDPRRAVVRGAVAMALGMAISVLALSLGSLSLFIVGDILSGIGIGASFVGAVVLITAHARAHERAELFATVYIVSYLSLGAPAILAGFLLKPLGPTPVATGYAIGVAALAGVGLGTHILRGRTPPRPTTRPRHRLSGAPGPERAGTTAELAASPNQPAVRTGETPS
ncbi:MFS transporter [Streptomyces sp. WAC 04229]|uniref:MFS transporter n=1 Tax=Streptomyces sp. WAC 04229 TaxID=2203206 RepID=UPI003D7288C7